VTPVFNISFAVLHSSEFGGRGGLLGLFCDILLFSFNQQLAGGIVLSSIAVSLVGRNVRNILLA
jgi:hypothetical protein